MIKSIQVNFEELKKVVKTVGILLYPYCEVVLHDFSDFDHSVVAIENNLTGRKLGSPATPWLKELVKGNQDIYSNYHNVTINNKDFKSSLILIRDVNNLVVGALSFNYDITNNLANKNNLDTFLGFLHKNSTNEEVSSIKNHTLKEIHPILNNYCKQLNKKTQELTFKEKKVITKKIKELGLFNLQGGVSIFAKLLGVSRTTIYKLLK